MEPEIPTNRKVDADGLEPSVSSDSTDIEAQYSTPNTGEENRLEDGFKSQDVEGSSHSNSVEDQGPRTEKAPIPAAEAPAAVQTNLNDWNGPDDKDNPQLWPAGKKAFHVFIPAAIAFTTTFASTIYVLGREEVMQHFHVTTTVSILPYSLYTLGVTFGPIVAASLSENYGRRMVYLISVPLFGCFIIGSGFAQNITTLVICRFLAGLFGSPGMSIGSGTIADLYELKARAIPMAIFIAAPFCGPSVGPIVGGYVVQYKDWRWTMWVVLFLTAAVYVPTLFMKETYKIVILRKRHHKATNAEKRSMGIKTRDFLHSNLVRPLQFLFTEAIVAAFGLYTFFVLAEFYTTLAALPYIYGTIYQFKEGSQGLPYISIGIGVCLGALVMILYSKRSLKKMIKTKTRPPPEARLLLARVGSIGLPVGQFWFGWSAHERVHWICPTIALGLIGWSIFMIFMPCSLYVVDCYGPRYAASAVTATRISGYLGGVCFPLFTIQMYSGLNVGWASSILGFIALAMSPVPWCFSFWGPALRKRTKYGPTPPAAPPKK